MNTAAKTPKLVYVIWYDSVGWRHGWSVIAEAKKLEPTRCETVAFLVEETKTNIVVASTVSNGGEVYSPLAIPKITIEDWGACGAARLGRKVRPSRRKRAKKGRCHDGA